MRLVAGLHADARQDAGEFVIVVWTGMGTQHYISHPEMPGAFLTAPKAQCDEAVSGFRARTNTASGAS